LGLGPGAHSFAGGVRWWNVSGVGQYCRSLARGRAPLRAREALSGEQLRLEALYLGLRTKEGAPLDLLRRTPGGEQILAELQKSGLIEMNRDRVAPTRRGFLLADNLPLRFMDGDPGEDTPYQSGPLRPPAPSPAPCRQITGAIHDTGG
jgi:oxygen-independent coproporphyrinogen-3 oxidase